MLISVKKLDYTTKGHAPLVVDAVVNTDYVISVIPIKTRRTEECVQVNLHDGSSIDCVGSPSDFLFVKKEEAK